MYTTLKSMQAHDQYQHQLPQQEVTPINRLSHISNVYTPPLQAGMSVFEEIPRIQQQIIPDVPQKYKQAASTDYNSYTQTSFPQPTLQQPQYTTHLFNCVDIAKHIRECPVCSKLYQPHTNTTMLYIIIFVLSLCILLLCRRLSAK